MAALISKETTQEASKGSPIQEMKSLPATTRDFKRLHKGNKYNAKRTEYNGRTFDSKGEAARAAELDLMLKNGLISDLNFQPDYRLTDAAIRYRADFSYIRDGKLYAEDFKGVETDRFKMIKKLWLYYGPVTLLIYDKSGFREKIDPRTITTEQQKK